MALSYIYLLSVLNMTYYHPEDPGYFNFYISGYEDTQIRLQAPWWNADSLINLNTDNNWFWNNSHTLTKSEEQLATVYGVRAAASKPVTIQVSRGKVDYTNVVSYTAMPLTNYNSTEFYLSSQPSSSNGLKGASPIFVVGAHDRDATIGLYRKSTGITSRILSMTVKAGQFKEFSTRKSSEWSYLDLTGLYINSTSPIVVYSGHQCGNVPRNVLYCEPLFQFIPPLTLIGQDYVIGPITLRNSAGYTVRVVFTEDNTELRYNKGSSTVRITKNLRPSCSLPSSISGTLSCPRTRAGQYLEFRVAYASYAVQFTCSKPCYVYQLNHGGRMAGTSSSIRTDPYMSVVPPTNQNSKTIKFSTISSFSRHKVFQFVNFISIIVPYGSKVMLDNKTLPTRGGKTVGTWVALSSRVQPGNHSVQSEDGQSIPMVVQVYGHGPRRSRNFSGQSGYGFPAVFPAHPNTILQWNFTIPPTYPNSLPPKTTPPTTTATRTTTRTTFRTLRPYTPVGVSPDTDEDGNDSKTGLVRVDRVSVLSMGLIIVAVLVLMACVVGIVVFFAIRRNRINRRSPVSPPPVNRQSSYTSDGVPAYSVAGLNAPPPIYTVPGPVVDSPPVYATLYPSGVEPPKYEAAAEPVYETVEVPDCKDNSRISSSC